MQYKINLEILITIFWFKRLLQAITHKARLQGLEFLRLNNQFKSVLQITTDARLEQPDWGNYWSQFCRKIP